MKRVIQMLVFVSLFSLLLFLLHLFVFQGLSALLGLSSGIAFWAFLVIASVSYPLGMALSYWSNGLAARAFNTLASIWLGFVVLLFFLLIPVDVAMFFLGLDGWLAGIAVLYVAIGLTALGAVNSLYIKVTEVEIRSRRAPRDLRIVHFADLHLGPIYGRRYLERVVGIANRLEPELVLITGDLIDGPYRYSEEMLAPLGELRAPMYMCCGNHEHIAGPDVVRRIVDDHGGRLLLNEAADLDGVQLVGLDDGWRKETILEDLDKIELDRDRYVVLMEHQPRAFDEISKMGVDLMLSGHAHGGQTFPFTLMVKWAYGTYKGLYERSGSHLYVTTGAGTWGPPLRLGSCNEVALIRITKA